MSDTSTVYTPISASNAVREFFSNKKEKGKKVCSINYNLDVTNIELFPDLITAVHLMEKEKQMKREQKAILKLSMKKIVHKTAVDPIEKEKQTKQQQKSNATSVSTNITGATKTNMKSKKQKKKSNIIMPAVATPKTEIVRTENKKSKKKKKTKQSNIINSAKDSAATSTITREVTANDASASTVTESQTVNAAATTNVTIDPKNGRNKRNYRRKNRSKVHTKLDYAFTKSIPCPPMSQVKKPNREKHQAALNALQSQVDVLTKKRQALWDVIKDVKNRVGKKNSERHALRINVVNSLKHKKNTLIKQKKVICRNLDARKVDTEKKMKDEKHIQRNLKYSSMEWNEAEIENLQTQQETTTLTLSQEKMLLKQMNRLQATKKVQQCKSTKALLKESRRQSLLKERRKMEMRTELLLKERRAQLFLKERQNQMLIKERRTRSLINEKDRDIDIVTTALDEVITMIQNHRDMGRKVIQGLYTELNAYTIKIAAIFAEKAALCTAFRQDMHYWRRNS